jgi:hypothetical protein
VGEDARQEVQRLGQECQLKQEQNEKLRRELNELWSKLNASADYTVQQEATIRQLKQAQTDLQETMRLQRESSEKETTSYRSMYEQMAGRYEECVKEEKRQVGERRQMEVAHLEKIGALEYEIGQLRVKSELQAQQITDKRMVCDGLTKKIEELEGKDR